MFILVHHDLTHIACSPHNNIEIREQVGRMQKLAPNQAIVKCWSLDLNPGMSASEIWALFHGHPHVLSYLMLVLVLE